MENIVNKSVVVGTASVLISPQLIEGQRNAIAIINTSTGGQTISITWGEPPAAGKGVVLAAGQSWNESRDNAFTPSCLPIYVISSAALGAVAVMDRIRGE